MNQILAFAPFPKNPTLGAFFREIDRADELGSGMRKMMLYGKKYGEADPQLIEGDVFRMIINVPEFNENQANVPGVPGETGINSVTDQLQATPEVGTKLSLSRHQVEIMRKCLQDSPLLELIAITGRSDRTKFRHQVLNELLESGLIKMTIPDKPRSSKQKYRTTDKGKELLESTK